MAKDFIKQNNFKFTFNYQGLDDIELTIQEVNMPDLTMNNVMAVEPYRDVKFGGTKIDFSEVTISFIVDENMTNWLVLHKWAKLLRAGEEIYPTGMMGILTNKNNYQIMFYFEQMVLESLSGFQFTTMDSSATIITATATFWIYNMDFEIMKEHN